MTDLFVELGERDGLLQSWITTRADLNAAERDNIDAAAAWAYRLVFVHPFPNGNGRHARLMVDLLIRRMGSPAFSWGGGGLQDMNNMRRTYVDALRNADKQDYSDLIAFSRS